MSATKMLGVGVNVFRGYNTDSHTRLDDQAAYPQRAWLLSVGARVRLPTTATPFTGTAALATSVTQSRRLPQPVA